MAADSTPAEGEHCTQTPRASRRGRRSHLIVAGSLAAVFWLLLLVPVQYSSSTDPPDPNWMVRPTMLGVLLSTMAATYYAARVLLELQTHADRRQLSQVTVSALAAFLAGATILVGLPNLMDIRLYSGSPTPYAMEMLVRYAKAQERFHITDSYACGRGTYANGVSGQGVADLDLVGGLTPRGNWGFSEPRHRDAAELAAMPGPYNHRYTEVGRHADGRPLDHTREYCLCACYYLSPKWIEKYGDHQEMSLFVYGDRHGFRIYARTDDRQPPQAVPRDPEAEGWVLMYEE